MPDRNEDDLGSAEVHVETGFPRFEHNQWTIEGEIERFGAFGRGGARARGWKRVVAVLIALAVVVPILVGLVLGLWQAVT